MPAVQPSPEELGQLTPQEVENEIIRTFGPLAGQALCIAGHESGFRWNAVNTTGNYPPSRDRGVFQINDYYHPDVSDQQAFNAFYNIHRAYQMRLADGNWHAWATRVICGLW